MSIQFQDIKAIFLAALEKASAQERAAYLDQSCGHDSELRRRVETLIKASEESGAFLDQPVVPAPDLPGTLAYKPIADEAGSVIGPYKLLEQIGEGGFGVVFMAEQTQPVRRKVALKVLKPGMDTRQVVARFEAERQALAIMDHPNIARVFDGGVTTTGRPYFVMELVKGMPITDYCDQNHLTPRERLELFVNVCQAVQHAHQKGVIHRDLKPSNVLVTVHDTKPVVKVIDFGVAKAMGQELTDKTLFTGFAQMIGTPLYMSPEQAGQSGLDIDTRSDIYSLGVLLYELLTGSTPFDKQRFKKAAYDEIRRIIREEEPPKPSTRLGELDRHATAPLTPIPSPPAAGGEGRRGEGGSTAARPHHPSSLASVAAMRGTEPKKLSGLMRGELDWIVMKALDKDRNRRYETPNGFAMDIQRYLNDEHVLACPPSAGYRLRKFARRNRAAILTFGAIAATLVVGSLVSTWLAIRATTAEKLAQSRLVAESKARDEADAARRDADTARAEAETARDKEKELREEAEEQKQLAQANFAKAREAVDRYLTDVTENELLSVPGLQSLRQELLEAALPFYAEFTQQRSDDPSLQRDLAIAHYRLAIIQRELGSTDASQAASGEAIRLLEALRDKGEEVLTLLANMYFIAKRYDEAVRLCQEVLKTDPENWEIQSTLAETYNTLAIAKSDAKDLAAALQHHQQAFEIRQKLVLQHPDSAEYNAELGSTLNNIGVVLSLQKKTTEKLAMFQLALPYNQKASTLKPHSVVWRRWLATTLLNIGTTQSELGRHKEALQALEQHTAALRRMVAENPAVNYLRSDYYKALLRLSEQQRRMRLTVEANRSARDARDVLTQIRRETPAEKFELATVYAALATPPDQTRELESDDPDAADERQRNFDLALTTLKQAVDAGWCDPAALKNYRVLDVLRKREEFQQLASVVVAMAEANKLFTAAAKDAETKLANQQRVVEILANVSGGIAHRKTLAATLHSMGVIQTGLEQFAKAGESLNQAIAMRAALRVERPDDTELMVDWLTSRVAQGQLYWQQAQYPQAHRVWQQCLMETKRHCDAAPPTSAIVSRLVGLERSIYQRYGELGLMPIVQEFTNANGRQRGLQAVDVGAFVTDGEFSAAMLLMDDRESARNYFQNLGKSITQSETPELQWELVQFVRGASLLGIDAAIDAAVIEKIRTIYEADRRGGRDWVAVATAMYDYRAGDFERAGQALKRLAAQDNWGAYLDAAVCWKRGDRDRAKQRWSQAEATYERRCHTVLFRSLRDGLGASATGVYTEHWWQFVYGQALRRLAAEVLAEGQPVPADPWLHLIQARGYHLIGEHAKADAEMAAVTAATPNDPDLWTAVARLRAQWDQPAAARAGWDKAIELSGNDPLPWIHRGRWYAERGEHQKADADFAKAASLTPNELNKFIEAGWWVVGPYPPQLQQFCPPEIDPDPSKPVHIVDPKTGLSDQPLPWQYARTGQLGRVDLKSVFNADQMSAYALTYAYAPEERTATLLVGGDDTVRVWVNGHPEYDSDKPATWHFGLARVPITLRAGRNVILAKVGQWSAGHSLSVRLADTPLDRAFTAAENWLWDDAAKLFDEALKGDERIDSHAWRMRGITLMASGDTEGHRRHGERAKEKFRHSSNPHEMLALAHICGLSVETVGDAEQLLKWSQQGQLPGENEKWGKHFLAMAYYRANQFQQAIDCIQENFDAHNLTANLLLSMAQFRQGEKLQAQQSLRKSEAEMLNHLKRWVVEKHIDSVNWSWWAEHFIRLREAKRLIDGTAPEHDAVLATLQNGLRAKLYEETPTSDFDRAISVEPSEPRHLLARARRLTELGRLNEAESDFNKANELKPNDADILTARGAFLADRGDLTRAAADFHTALDSFGNERWLRGLAIDLEAIARKDLFARLAALRPDDEFLRIAQRSAQSHDGELHPSAASRRDFERFGPSYQTNNAAFALLRNDIKEYENLRRLATEGMPPFQRTILLGLMPTSEPITQKLLTAADENIREGPQVLARRRLLGLAQLRAGKFAEALTTLKDSLGPSENWQNDGTIWPMLAMTSHHLGNSDEARTWLRKCETWLEFFEQLPTAELGRITGLNKTQIYDWILGKVFYFEAKALIDGSDAALAARKRMATRADGRKRLAQQAAERRQRESLAKITANWQQAVDRAGNDPLPWIRRGRWHAERGEHDKADADFAQAASLTPNELNKFLEAGWWAVGPYAQQLSDYCPPEADPDPSRPVHVVYPQKGLSDEPVLWRTIPIAAGGAVDAGSVLANHNNAWAYAMAYVYSPDERSLLLRLDAPDGIRLWVNGELVRENTKATLGNLYADRLPVTVRKGRNVILVKFKRVLNELSLGDDPANRLLTLAEQRRFRDVAEFDTSRAPATDGNMKTAVPLLMALALNGDMARFESECRDFLSRRVPGAAVGEYWWISRVAAQVPNAEFEAHRDRLVSFAEAYARQYPVRWSVLNAAFVNYRAGRLDRALEHLNATGDKNNDLDSLAQVLRALVAHSRGERDEAKRSLAEARTRYESMCRQELDSEVPVRVRRDTFTWWYDWSQFQLLLAEAATRIEGDATAVRQLGRAVEEHYAAHWSQRDPQTVAFDHAVLMRPADNSEDRTYPFLARGKRLAELGRWEEAEADFNRAIELKKNDAESLTARGTFFAACGQPDKAAADFHAALNLIKEPSQPRWNWGLPIDRVVAQYPDVFDRLTTLRPRDGALWRMRMNFRTERGELDGAAADSQRVEELAPLNIAAIWALLRGDHQELNRIRAKASSERNAITKMIVMGLAPTDEPMTSELLDTANNAWQKGPQDEARRRQLGIAQLRAGKFAEAVASLEGSLEMVGPATEWHRQGLIWPLLAMAHHHVGNTERAQAWLNKSTIWFQLYSTAGDRFFATTGPSKMQLEGCTAAALHYLEARALIDGPAVAAEVRDEWFKKAAARRRDDDVQRQNAVSRARAARQQLAANTEADLAEAIRRNPNDGAAWSELGRFCSKAGRLDEAAAHFAKGLALIDRDPSYNPWAKPDLESIEHFAADRDDLFERLAKLAPNHRNLWIARAHHFGRRLDLQLAQAPLDKAVELDPTDFEGWHHKAAIELCLGDNTAYTASCREALARFANDDGPRIANRLARTCLLAPGAVEDSAPILELVERVKQQTGLSAGQQRWDLQLQALSAYRLGRFADAIGLVEQCVTAQSQNPYCDSSAYFLSAMAHHRLGQKQQAHTALESGLQLIEETRRRPQQGQLLGFNWPDWARTDPLRREAQAIIAGERNDFGR